MGVIAFDQLPHTGNFSREFIGGDQGVEGISFILVEAPPGAGPSLHTHPYDEICIVQEGQARYTLDDQELDVGPGQVVVVPAGVPHAFVNTGEEPLRQVDIHAATRFATEWLQQR